MMCCGYAVVVQQWYAVLVQQWYAVVVQHCNGIIHNVYTKWSPQALHSTRGIDNTAMMLCDSMISIV